MPRGGPVYRHEIAAAPKNKSLQASSRVYTAASSQKLRKAGRRTRDRQWQEQLWDLYDIVGEFRYGCDWVGSLLSRAKLYVAGPNGEETDKSEALDAMASLFDGPEGQEEMLRLLGINFTVAGEAFIIGEPGEGRNGRDSWRVAASSEVSEEAHLIQVEGERLSDNALAIRLWKAHPRVSRESNSPARAALPILNQMVKLSQVVDAQADSRLTSAGILFLPSELEMPSVPVTDADGETESVQAANDIASGVTARLIAAAKIAIEDRDSAAAQIPQVLVAPGEYLEKAVHLQFWSGFDEHAKALREEAISRLAIAMDMPPEILTGSGDMNHWNSIQMEEAAIKAHSEPLLNLIVASLTTGYLHPYLESVGVEDFESYTIEADTSELRLRPNRSKEALELYDRGELRARTLLIENGFDPDSDTPSDEERQKWFLQKVASGSTTPDQVSAALNQLGVSAIPGSVTADQQSTEARPVRSLERHPNRDAPLEEDSEAQGMQASAAFLADGLTYAAEQMVYRALERAGNRLKARVGRNIGGFAMDLYLSTPRLSATEAEALLEDAWTTIDRFECPGVSPSALRDALNSYTLMLLRLQKPHTREALARHLLLELS